MKEKVIEKIVAEKIIAIVRGVKKEDMLPLAEAMYKGGIRLMEITYDASHPETNAETAEQIQLLAETYAGKMYVGAGTVLTQEQVELTKQAGGTFIISPDSNPEVIRKTCELGMVSIPGALTPSEATQAVANGADFVKLFPITGLGSSYVKAIKAPLSHIRFLAVGGVSPDNMQEFADAGVCGFGIGSNIADKKLIEKGAFDEIEKLAKVYTSLLK